MASVKEVLKAAGGSPAAGRTACCRSPAGGARTEGTLRVHTNTIEGFFGLFKIGILGIHHWVSAKHLHRYATEHEFRYNKRGHDVGERIARCLIGQHGRLRLRELFA